ncbi:hypothetical protein BT96DRAFT_1098130, partial [Gymnopus androsaceus JB14]
GGVKPSTHSKARAGKANNNASDTETKSAQGSTRLSDYKSTLNVSAPAAQSQARAEKPYSDESDQEARLNSTENQFLDDVLPEREDLPEEPNSDGNELEDSEQDTDGEEEDNAFQDVTNASGSKPRVNKEGSHKVLLSEFENRKLALFAKCCARKATCLVAMCPEDPLYSWPTFTEEFERLVKEGRCLDFVESLEQINGDPEGRDKLMNYGCSAVRYDLGKETRIRTGQFYDIPGTRSSTEMISVVTWLLKDRRYHHSQVDLEMRTTDNFPFRTPLLAYILRGYFIEGRPKRDSLLIATLHRERRIPVALIVMATVLIGHAIQEFASGYQMIHALTTTNLVSHYRSVAETMSNLQQQAAPYVERLRTDLYEAMMSAGPQIIPSQTYDYAALNQFASKPEESDQPVGDENGRGSTTETHVDVNEEHGDDHGRVNDGEATDPEPGSQGGPKHDHSALDDENGLAEGDKQIIQHAPKILQASEGLAQTSAGLFQASAGISQASAGLAQASAGVSQVSASLAQASAGLAQASAGLFQASVGVSQASAGLFQASAGISQASAGLCLQASARSRSEHLQVSLRHPRVSLRHLQVFFRHLQVSLRSRQASAGVSQVSAGLAQASAGVSQASAGLAQASAGVSQVSLKVSQVSLKVSRVSLKMG